jgi:hypothetical protein
MQGCTVAKLMAYLATLPPHAIVFTPEWTDDASPEHPLILSDCKFHPDAVVWCETNDSALSYVESLEMITLPEQKAFEIRQGLQVLVRAEDQSGMVRPDEADQLMLQQRPVVRLMNVWHSMESSE